MGVLVFVKVSWNLKSCGTQIRGPVPHRKGKSRFSLVNDRSAMVILITSLKKLKQKVFRRVQGGRGLFDLGGYRKKTLARSSPGSGSWLADLSRNAASLT
jgi:hypothetical protein